MFKNYCKTALRHLRKHKTYSFINLFGLATGLACCTIIALYIYDEVSFDHFHQYAARIFRVGFASRAGSENWSSARTPHALGPALQSDFPEIQALVRFLRMYQPLVQYHSQRFVEPQVYYAEAAVFDAFTFPLLKGEAGTALASPFSLVLTEEMAAKYFGTENSMGKTLTIAEVGDFQVTGVLKNIPARAHFQFDFLVSYSTLAARRDPNWEEWGAIVTSTYVLLPEGYSPAQLAAKFPAFLRAHLPAEMQAEAPRLFLNPLLDLHLRSELPGELGQRGNVQTLYLLALVAAFILLIACLNFMNLATARSLPRAREVGVRKVMGAQRAQLVRQFLGEAVFLTMGSLLLAVPMLEICLPRLNRLMEKHLAFAWHEALLLAGLGVALGLLVGVLAGSYPAAVLSAFPPAALLRGPGAARPARTRLRQTLVVAQFTISLVLAMSTMIAAAQLDFFRKKQLGFQKEHVVILPLQNHALPDKYETIKRELAQHASVLGVAASGQLPGSGLGKYFYTVEGSSQTLTLATYFVDMDFLPTLGMQLAAGRNFSKNFPGDASHAFLINETAARALGWKQAIGKSLDWDGGAKKGTVIGVVRDFHFESLHTKIEPLVLQLPPEPQYLRFIVARLAPGGLAATLRFLKQKWGAFDAQYPFQYFFLDEDFDQLYRQEARLTEIFRYAAALALGIACLGLLGLAAFAAEQRTKEIGVRKVMGASAAQILALMSRDYSQLVMLAFLVAIPIAYVAMRHWLQNFAYRTAMNPLWFISAGAMAMLLAGLTVGYHALKAARTNPVEALRYE